ncbi:hypothetical protein S7711_03729 [Stachybotrys chartarum IBT 7711]|uniref:SAC3/GANP/THP3 conserved domain-containing protein n=1 Tax=Stachybotrys chartarum (strain CBS 109288 / IBT 7711) TaxID=1280523 RepID=A0A084AWR9_STACB|nr:hypothetical protein S7711_03729 [Stachybotrys chartarum IBT 7711]
MSATVVASSSSSMFSPFSQTATSSKPAVNPFAPKPSASTPISNPFASDGANSANENKSQKRKVRFSHGSDSEGKRKFNNPFASNDENESDDGRNKTRRADGKKSNGVQVKVNGLDALKKNQNQNAQRANGFGLAAAKPNANRPTATDGGVGEIPRSNDPHARKVYEQLRRDGVHPPSWPSQPGNPKNKAEMAKFRERYEAYRDKVRASLTKAGLIDDPEQRKSLQDAIDFKGICEDMCPEFEKITRITELDVVQPEKDPRTTFANTAHMVKKLARSAAGQEAPLPMDVRSVATLRHTLDYLIDDLLREDGNLPAIHGFLWDRTRAIRRDFTFFSSLTPEELKDQVYVLENIARFHVTALHLLSQDGMAPEDFVEQQELEQLGKALLSLRDVYDDCAAQGIKCENEAEFRAYYLVFHAHDPNIMEIVQRQWSPHLWRDSDEIRTAVSLVEAMQNTHDFHGPLKDAPSLAAAQSSHGFFRIMKDPSVSYTMACFAECHLPHLRRTILRTVKRALARPKEPTKDVTAAVLNRFLQFDSVEEAIRFAELHDLQFVPDEEDPSDPSRQYLILNNRQPLPHHRLQHQFSYNLVEKKRGIRSLPDLIHETVFEDPTASAKPPTEESLFVAQSQDEAPPKTTSNAFGAPTPSPFSPASNTGGSATAGSQASPFGSVSGSAFGTKQTKPSPAANPFAPSAEAQQPTPPTNPFASFKPTTTPSFAGFGNTAPTLKADAPSMKGNEGPSTAFASSTNQATLSPNQLSAPSENSSEQPTPTLGQLLGNSASGKTNQPLGGLLPEATPAETRKAPEPPSTSQPKPSFAFPAPKFPSNGADSSLATSSASLNTAFPPANSGVQEKATSPSPAPPSNPFVNHIPPTPGNPPSAKIISPFPENTTIPSPSTTSVPPPQTLIPPIGQATPQPAPPVVKQAPPRDLFGDFTKWFVTGDDGMLEHFQDFLLHQIVGEVFEKFQAEQQALRIKEEEERNRREADEFRRYNLSLKLFYLWRQNAREKRLKTLRRSGREQFRAFNEARRTAQQEAAKAAAAQAERERARLARLNRPQELKSMLDHPKSNSTREQHQADPNRQSEALRLARIQRKMNSAQAEQSLLDSRVLAGVSNEREAVARIVGKGSRSTSQSPSLTRSTADSAAREGAKTQSLREQFLGSNSSSFRRSLPPMASRSAEPSGQNGSTSRASFRWRMKAMGIPQVTGDIARQTSPASESAHHHRASTAQFTPKHGLSSSFSGYQTDSHRLNNEPSPVHKRKRPTNDDGGATQAGDESASKSKRLIGDAQETIRELKALRMELEQDAAWFRSQNERFQSETPSRAVTP